MNKRSLIVSSLFIFLFSVFCLLVFFRKQNLVTVYLQNGLGNRIFQVFAGLQYAAKYNKRFVISNNTNEVNIHEKDIDSSLKKLFPYVDFIDYINYSEKKDYYSMPFTYVDIPKYPDNVVLLGAFQSDKYFPSYIYSIRNTYYPNTYFLHIRGGDYLTNERHFVPLEAYYKRSIAIIKARDPKSKYIVFSNDNTYAKKILSTLHINYTISSKSSAYDVLVEMSNCAGGICANSSLSWLGGFYQLDKRGIICMPSKWMNTDDKTEDLYPSWATVVSV